MLHSWWDLFITFVRIGSVSFGGGYAMLPILQRELVERKGWASEEELIDAYALGQSLPGVIAANTAAFLGYTRHGIGGAIAAALGVTFPSLVVIMLIAAFLRHVGELTVVQHAFAGVRAAVVALIVSSVVRLGRQSIYGAWGVALAAAAVVAVAVFDVSPVWVVLLAAALGVAFAGRAGGRESRESPKRGGEA